MDRGDTTFDWPRDGVSKRTELKSGIKECWRRMTDFAIVEEHGHNFTLLRCWNEGRTLMLTGNLVPRPGYVFNEMIAFCVPVESFSIHYGQSSKDPVRGMWVKAKKNEWYKLEMPSESFATWLVLIQTTDAERLSKCYHLLCMIFSTIEVFLDLPRT